VKRKHIVVEVEHHPALEALELAHQRPRAELVERPLDEQASYPPSTRRSSRQRST
jgi:hypothetical protein